MAIAILITCHRREATTLRCLRKLLPRLGEGDRVFLVDDDSEMHPGYAISDQIEVVQGTGNLYWAKGMRLAWETAMAYEEGKTPFDGYLWLNDDVDLEVWPKLKEESVQVGEFVDKRGVKTYGLNDEGVFAGNFVYVPRAEYLKLGMLCGEYAHAWADTDYAIKCKRLGVKVESLGVVGKCEGHDIRPSLKGVGFRRRCRMLTDPKGWNVHDLWVYRKRNWGVLAAVVSCAHLVLHVLRGER